MHSPEAVTVPLETPRRRRDNTSHRSHSADHTRSGRHKPSRVHRHHHHRSRSDTEVDSEEDERRPHRPHRSSIQPHFCSYPPPPQVIYVDANTGSPLMPATPTPIMQLTTPTTPAIRLVASPPRDQSTEAPINASTAPAGEIANSQTPLKAPSGGSTGKSWSEGKLHALKESNKAREQSRQISQLVSDLDAVNELNRKLQEKLTETEWQLESLRISQQTLQTSLEADASGKAAALVDEIYRAQKQRDEAMMSRLQTANEERDAALERLRATETGSDGYESGPDDNADDMDMQSLLRGVTGAETPGQIKRHGGALADGISQHQRERRELNASEMRAVIVQRDDAIEKAKSMECDLLRLQRQHRARTAEKQQHSADKAKLLATQQERDVSLQKVQKLEDELQTLRVYYSLHKSLSQEAHLRDQFNHTLQDIEGELKQRDDVVDHAQKESTRLLSQMKDAMNSKNQMCEQLAKATAGQQEAEERCQRRL